MEKKWGYADDQNSNYHSGREIFSRIVFSISYCHMLFHKPVISENFLFSSICCCNAFMSGRSEFGTEAS